MKVPAGWALVPIEPTDEMLVAYRRALKAMIDATPSDVRDQFFAPNHRTGSRVPDRVKARIRWRAMLAAAPAPGGVTLPTAERLAKAILELNRAWLAEGNHGPAHGYADDEK